MKKIFANPLRIIIAWLIFSFVFTVLVYYIIGVTTPDVYQLPMEFVARMPPIIVYVTFGLSLITVPFYIKGVKKHWHVNLIFFVFCSLVIWGIRDDRSVEDKNGISVESFIANGKSFEKTVKYYDSAKIRQVIYTSNGQRDSVWTTYARDGSVIQQVKYKDGKLVSTAK